MTDNTVDTWQEIKIGVLTCFKIIFYFALSIGFFFGAGYVYFAYFQ